MFLLFTFSDGTEITSDFILESSKITQTYYNELKTADDSASFRIPFAKTLCDKIKAEISKNIKVQIKEDGTNVFTGYVRNTLTFSKTQRNQPFSLEVVSPSILLDTTYNGNTLHYSNTNLASVLTSLLSLTSFSGSVDVSKAQTQQINLFTIEDSENVKEVINEICYEFGFSYNFDANGNFYLTEIFNSAPTTITQKFNGDNCLNEITQQVKEDKYDRVSVQWNKVERRTDVLIFEDTSGANSNTPANIQIDAQSYYLGEQTNYLKYDSKFQKIGWIDSAQASISYDSTSGITENFQNLGIQGQLSIYNASTSARHITQLQIRGDGYFEISTNFTKVGQTGTESSVTAKYIQGDGDASRFAKHLADYYKYSNFTISVLSKTKYEIGTFVEVSEVGMGTINCRIIKRIWNIRENIYNYTLESVTEYTPSETYQTKQTVESRGDNGETLRDTVSDLSQRIDGIVTDTTMINADILSAIIKLDNEGKTITSQDFTTTISLKHNTEDLQFSIGQINLPSGWTYEVVDRQVKFHVGEGVPLRAGQFAIPVLYRTVISENAIVDQDGNQYVDENGNGYVEQVWSGSYTQWNLYFNYFGDNGGVYLGMIKTLAEIPSQNNYGDYFTWGGTNNTESALAYEGKFKQGRVYKYMGTKNAYQWMQDSDGGHGQIALSDVLSLADADLKNNNSTVYEYLDHLTSNSIYTSMITSDQAFINSIVGNSAFIQSLTSNTAFLTSLTSSSAFIEDLTTNSAFINKLTSNSLLTQNIKATQGFFDSITSDNGTFTNVNISGRFKSTKGITYSNRFTWNDNNFANLFSKLASTFPDGINNFLICNGFLRFRKGDKLYISLFTGLDYSSGNNNTVIYWESVGGQVNDTMYHTTSQMWRNGAYHFNGFESGDSIHSDVDEFYLQFYY